MKQNRKKTLSTVPHNVRVLRVILALVVIAVIVSVSVLAISKTKNRVTERKLTTSLAQAREAVGNNDVAKAEELYKVIVALPTATGREWRELAFVYQLGKKKTEAIDAYERSLAIDPNDATSLNSVANLYRDLNQHEKAEAAYQKAISLNPRFVTAIINLSHLYNLQHRYEDSIALLKTHYDATKQKSELGLQLVATHVLAGQTKEAKQIVNQVLAVDSENEKALHLSETL
jgi:tetratricopeptide (TPR) repeat protein